MNSLFKQPTMMNKTSVFDFGKYKNNSLGEVMKFDASYILWCIEQGLIDVAPYLYDEIDEAAIDGAFNNEINKRLPKFFSGDF